MSLRQGPEVEGANRRSGPLAGRLLPREELREAPRVEPRRPRRVEGGPDLIPQPLT